MKLYKNFIRIDINSQMRETAVYHAKRRTQNIVRQFIPKNAPLSNLESNYIGSLGEIAVNFYFNGNVDLEDNYDKHQVDSGDIKVNGLIYDIKTEALPVKFYRQLYFGTINEYDPYGCRVWTATHKQHLHKYTGGVIFAAAPIPNDSKVDRQNDQLRERIVDFASQLIIIGYVEQAAFSKKEPSWYSPPHPKTKKSRKYNSPNYIFHHSEIKPIKSCKRSQV